MERRAVLRVTVKMALLAGAAGFAWVFVHGLFSPGLLSNKVLSVGGIEPGAARLVSWNGRPVWVVHRSERQLAGLSELSEYVIVPETGAGVQSDSAHRSLDVAWGVYLAETGRSGILVQYTRQRPARLAADIPWHGGFVDPGSAALFDSAGRRYRGTQGEPLAVPPHRFNGNGALRLGTW